MRALTPAWYIAGMATAAALLPACSGGAPIGSGGAGGTTGNGAEYAIDRVIGGLDRLILVKRDRDRDYCVGVTLVNPGRAPADLALPANWGLEGLSSGESADACGRAFGVPDGASVSGRIAFASVGTTGWPCSVDLDLAVTLPAGAHAPASDRLEARNVPAPCER